MVFHSRRVKSAQLILEGRVVGLLRTAHSHHTGCLLGNRKCGTAETTPAVVAVNVVLATARHTLVPGELLGRVLGVWRTVVWGAIPVGALLGGALTEALGAAARTFLVSGAAMLGVAGFAFGSLRRFSLDDKSDSAACLQARDP